MRNRPRGARIVDMKISISLSIRATLKVGFPITALRIVAQQQPLDLSDQMETQWPKQRVKRVCTWEREPKARYCSLNIEVPINSPERGLEYTINGPCIRVRMLHDIYSNVLRSCQYG